MKEKVLVIAIIVLIVLAGVWLNTPAGNSNGQYWPSDECSQFFGNTQAARCLCGFIAVVVAAENSR